MRAVSNVVALGGLEFLLNLMRAILSFFGSTYALAKGVFPTTLTPLSNYLAVNAVSPFLTATSFPSWLRGASPSSLMLHGD